MKILNLYAGIGGNRKLWGDEHEITAIENNKEIAKIYQDLFPKDKVIITDAHQYLLKHFEEFDFIWSSPPCPTHSRMRKINTGKGERKSPFIYPDLKLYEEIIFLKHWFKGKWVVENVIPYYKPLINYQIASRHSFWANFKISDIKLPSLNIKGTKEHYAKLYGFDISKINAKGNSYLLRNCVNPKLGFHIFKCAFKDKQTIL